jgi:hypothetical protein
LASSDEVLFDTLLADLHGQITYGAIWAITVAFKTKPDHLKMEREGRFIFVKEEIKY